MVYYKKRKIRSSISRKISSNVRKKRGMRKMNSPVRKKKRRIQRRKSFSNQKLFGIIPYYITFSLILIILGITLMRVAPSIFGFTEVLFWAQFLGIVLVGAGILMLIAYWRNNVSNLTTRHAVKWN